MPDQYRVIVQSQGFKDLDSILDYIKLDSPQNAVETLERLWSACQSLAILPRRYKLYQRRANMARSIHSMPSAPFVVYYRVDERTRIVRVLTIRHGARRQPRRFK